jgi:hypothetical protein
LFLQGFYGVASADSGFLTLVVTDQNGATVSTTQPKLETKGGDSFVLSTTFTIPVGATMVCRAAVLQIGSLTLTETGDASLFPCLTVTGSAPAS